MLRNPLLIFKCYSLEHMLNIYELNHKKKEIIGNNWNRTGLFPISCVVCGVAPDNYW